MTWNNPVTNLWYTSTPTAASIVFDGQFYTLRIPAIPDFVYQPTTLAGAQSQYSVEATALLATSVTLTPNLPSISLPADGQVVAIATVGGGFAAGPWSSSNQSVTVSQQVIPLASIATWSPLP